MDGVASLDSTQRRHRDEEQDAGPAEGGVTVSDRMKVPGGIEAEDLGSKLRIARRPSRMSGAILAVVALFWTGVSWGSLLSSSSFELIPLLLGIVGLGLFYRALTMLVNSTTIEISQRELVIEEGPLPWPGSGTRRLPLDRICEFSCLYAEHQSSTWRVWSSGRTTYSWDLHVVTPEGRKVQLVTGIDQASHASFLEHELQRFLDTRVRSAKERVRQAETRVPTPQPVADEPRPDLEAALAEMAKLLPDLGEATGDR